MPPDFLFWYNNAASPSLFDALLRAGGDANEQDHNGKSALQVLLRSTITEFRIPSRGPLRIATALLQSGAKANNEELFPALLLRDRPLVRCLLDHGAQFTDQDPSGMTGLEVALLYASLPPSTTYILPLTYSSGSRRFLPVSFTAASPFWHADDDVVQGSPLGSPSTAARVTSSTATPRCSMPLRWLIWAASISFLKDEDGADVNAPPARDSGATALQVASKMGFMGIAKLLLDHGADVNAFRARKHGRTALEGAAEHGRLDMIALLLQHGERTTGSGRRQYIRSIKLAEKMGHFVAADFLINSQDWTDEDDAMLLEADILVEEGQWHDEEQPEEHNGD
ncbi:ankyrin repeat-containing domain protein [Lasiosphaeria ovina]|uniref:Ankyrin repeat-containing domain protein n=1 Tax=Lasiosphaeria ovina TaxID=92902 RepID=A0AAE0KCH1_9PEZI|nr:ankyrin repeat-containing domain protein [Lasiosphaeria ovina]